MLTLSTRLTLQPYVRFRRFDDEGILLDQEKGDAIVVSDVATRIIELSDGNRSLDDAARVLVAEFEIDDATLREDVLRFAQELLDGGLARASL